MLVTVDSVNVRKSKQLYSHQHWFYSRSMRISILDYLSAEFYIMLIATRKVLFVIEVVHILLMPRQPIV